MNYRKAAKIKVGDYVVDKESNEPMQVLAIEKDDDSNDLFFKCNWLGRIRTYHHTAIEIRENKR